MQNPDTQDEALGEWPPTPGELRFVERPHPGDPFRTIRILQRYEWSYVMLNHAWFDVPLVEEE